MERRILGYGEIQTWTLIFDGNKVTLNFENTDGAKAELRGRRSNDVDGAHFADRLRLRKAFERAVKLESPAQMLLINTIVSTFPADFKFRKRPRCGLQVDCNWGEQKQ
jgi:hypothetical protein